MLFILHIYHRFPSLPHLSLCPVHSNSVFIQKGAGLRSCQQSKAHLSFMLVFSWARTRHLCSLSSLSFLCVFLKLLKFFGNDYFCSFKFCVHLGNFLWQLFILDILGGWILAWSFISFVFFQRALGMWT